ncbi:hypothetical protein QC760_008940 [Botrytis cinerea]
MSLAQWVDAFPFLTMPHKTPAAKQASRDRSRKVVLTYVGAGTSALCTPQP